MTADEFIAKKNKDFAKNPIIKIKDIGREGNHFLYREAWTFTKQSNLPEKVFIIERFRKETTEGTLAYRNWKKGDIEYRIGYYIVGQIGRARGRWVWGQFCPIIPAKDLKSLFKKAKQEGVIK